MFSETELAIARHLQETGLYSQRLLADAVLREAGREPVFFASIIGIDHKGNINHAGFGVRAENKHEALGKANVIAERVYKGQRVHASVNELGFENAIVEDPLTAGIVD